MARGKELGRPRLPLAPGFVAHFWVCWGWQAPCEVSANPVLRRRGSVIGDVTGARSEVHLLGRAVRAHPPRKGVPGRRVQIVTLAGNVATWKPQVGVDVVRQVGLHGPIITYVGPQPDWISDRTTSGSSGRFSSHEWCGETRDLTPLRFPTERTRWRVRPLSGPRRQRWSCSSAMTVALRSSSRLPLGAKAGRR